MSSEHKRACTVVQYVYAISVGWSVLADTAAIRQRDETRRARACSTFILPIIVEVAMLEKLVTKYDVHKVLGCRLSRAHDGLK